MSSSLPGLVSIPNASNKKENSVLGSTRAIHMHVSVRDITAGGTSLLAQASWEPLLE